jgi:integrase
MSILSECPMCHKKMALKHKKCTKCSLDLKNLKKNGRINYHVRYYVPGSQKIKSVLAGQSLKEAQRIDSEYKATNRKVATGMIDNIPQTDLVFEDLFLWFLRLYTTKKLKDLEAKKIHFDRFNTRFGKTKVVRLRASMLKNFQAELKDEGLSDRYVDYIIADARQAVRTASDDDILSSDCLKPFNRTPRLLKPRANARDQVFSSDEFELIYKKASAHIKPIIATGYYTGMRKGEILNLRRSRLYLKENCIRLKAEDTKEGKPKFIPIVKPLLGILEKVPACIHTEYVFLYRGKPIKDIRKGFSDAVKGAGLKYGQKVEGGYIFHDLRHTFVTFMRKSGVPESVIMSITGHQTRSMFDRYNRVDIDDKFNASDRYIEYMKSIQSAIKDTAGSES